MLKKAGKHSSRNPSRIAISSRFLQGNETARALRERIKELTCLYSISQLTVERDPASYSVFQGFAEAIPPAWQYPEAAEARIIVDGNAYKSPGFIESRERMTAPVVVRGKKRGTVEVIYTRSGHGTKRVKFLKEEFSLLRAIA